MSRSIDVYDLRAEVVRLARDLGADELRCLLWIGRRLAAGQRSYGSLDLRRDGRDFVLEASEELLDTVAYCAMGALAGAGRSRAHPSSILGSVCAIVADGTPILFADDAWSAAALAERLLVKFWKRAVAARHGEAA